jgi:hypothetical protein
MIHKRAVLLSIFALCVAVLSSCAQPAAPAAETPPAHPMVSDLGDKAPPITVIEWVKGKPVKVQPGTNFYAVVFCTLTKANELAVTNLSALQKKYRDKGLIVTAISYEPPQQLRDFVRYQGDKIDFAVAADDMPARTQRAFAIAFAQNRLPLAYVINQEGKVVWFGHPLTDGMGEVVDQLASGRFNLEQTKKDLIHREQVQEYITLARQNDVRAAQAGRILLTLWTNDASALCDLTLQIVSSPYIENRDTNLINAALDRVAQISTTNTTDIAVDRAILLFQTGQEEAALALARKALPGAKTSDDQAQVKTCIHAMEVRIAAEKANAAAGATNSAAATR